MWDWLVLPGYANGSLFKRASLWTRDRAFWAGYIGKILDAGVINSWDHVVELWSWQGHKSKTLLKASPEIRFNGIEISPDMIARAQKRLPKESFRQGDMTNPDDIPDNIDVACYFQSLHHLDVEGRWLTAKAVHQKLSPTGKIVIIDSLRPEEPWVKQERFDTRNRAYAVLSQYPWNKLQQIYHSIRSRKEPDDYNPEELGYHSPERSNILWEAQSELFHLRAQITPFGWKAISDIMIFEKR